MLFSVRELFTILHGIVFGGFFLLAFAGVLVEYLNLQGGDFKREVIGARLARLKVWLWIMTALAWLTVLVGSFVVYPWYRAKPPAGTTDFTQFPRSLLLAHPQHSGWHVYGMEWKEHLGWIVPILMTAVAWVIGRYAGRPEGDRAVHRIVVALLATAFGCAVVTGMLGAFINKIAPVH